MELNRSGMAIFANLPRKKSPRFTEEEMAIFTRSEREDRKYTIGQAVTSARRTLAKHGIRTVCVNAVNRRLDSTPITLVELNRLAKAMVDDTCYHAVDSDYFPGRAPRRPW